MTDTGQHIEAVITKNILNQPVIQFEDLAYVRSDRIIFEPESRDVHAVLHENLYFIGKVPEGLDVNFANSNSVMLMAEHYQGYPVTLSAPVSIRAL